MSEPPGRPLAWVVGAGGLVGRHVVAAEAVTGSEVVTTEVPWRDEAASIDALTDAVADLAARRAGRPWTVAWCAGAGVVATAEEALESEVRVFAATMRALRTSLTPEDDGVVFLASSAGGLYAGSRTPPFDERSDPRPLVPYGRAKLAMEQHVADLVRGTGLRALLGRLSNVYGPGQTLGKPQGLLSQLCLAHATGRPLPVFVSMDTIRDYLYAPDAGRMVVRAVDLARLEPPGTVVAKVLASGAPVTVGHLVAEARRVFHRPLRTIPVGGRGAGQVLDLRLSSTLWPEVDALASTTLPAGLSRTGADVLARVTSGGPLDG
ncbi:NAD-dependent epimerase/dehydratase family protein [Oryzobacter terrae]|uniref:NAD-dependent epimerase/dehydratase family protein n=1 Tax=Oryzobacter terrae TaxID=1620385 RepID=UPI003672576D